MRRRALIRLAAGSLVAPALHPAARASAAPALAAGIAADFFGMHFHRLPPPLTDAGGRAPTVWPSLPIGAVRLWDSTTRWADLAPGPGRWDFRRLDALVSQAEAHGSSIIYTLGSPPRWASARPDEPGPYGPGCAAEPKSNLDWSDYVTRVADRYQARISAYEVWNEPYFSDFEADRKAPGFFSGSAAQMVELTRIVRETLDRVAPSAILLSPGFIGGLHRMERYLEAGASRYLQGMAYHFYCDSADELVATADRIRSLMVRHGMARAPLWNTECGVVDPQRAAGDVVSEAARPTPASNQATSLLATLLIVAAASRLERFYYHAWDNDLTGLVGRHGEPRALQPTFARVQRWIMGFRIEAPIRLEHGGWRVDAGRAGERRLFAWSPASQIVDLTLAEGWRPAEIETLAGAARSPLRSGGRTTTLELGPAPLCLRLVPKSRS